MRREITTLLTAFALSAATAAMLAQQTAGQTAPAAPAARGAAPQGGNAQAPAEGARGARRGGGAGGGAARAGGAPTFGTDESAPLLFEEKWTRAPMSQPMKLDSLGNKNLTLHLYGDTAGIRKTFHETEDYTYTGETRSNWMITVSDPTSYFDMRLPGKVMLRTRNTGFRQTHVAIRTADGNYYVSEEGSGESRAWMNRDYILQDLHWRSLTMEDTPSNAASATRPKDPARHVIVAAGVATPDLSRVAEIGFTDLMPGGFIPSTTRVNAWAVYGKKVAR
jgi:hypothetical protein